MDTLDATFSALADPTRRAILARLALGPANPNELALPFSISQPAISKHLKVLERAGLITRGRVAQSRPCSIDAMRIKEVAAWAEGYRQYWTDSFDRLDTYLHDLQVLQDPQDPPHPQQQQPQETPRAKRQRIRK